MDRRTLLTAGAVLAGTMVLPAVARTSRAAAVTSWPHSLENLMQNGVGSTSGSVHMHWDLPHDDFTIDLCFKVFNTHAGTQGWFIWREQNSSNYYQLQMYSDKLSIVRRIAGVFVTIKTCPYVINPTREMMVRVTVVGDHHQVFVLNADGTAGALLLDVHDSTYMSGVNHSYYVAPGVNGCWDFARGRPL